jgi:uncharacterized alkaline shock family protein YloU
MEATMEEVYQSAGSTTIATDVLLTIAQLTALSVHGVSRLSPLRGKGMELLLKHGQARDGVKIEVSDDIVYADIFVILKNDINVRDVSHTIQRDVARAISEMVGMQVGRINIHIEDIDYPAGG